ncbi:hypothetical protein CHARACLAT_010093 [Characodon lateralis]|uniref:Uncharacterized protein n=1 Tax=Characodon lateralis TaxID=208331 RepID=A0ABU7DZ82_9TELE|nr:hypothetical protein [Characodon lateralis]
MSFPSLSNPIPVRQLTKKGPLLPQNKRKAFSSFSPNLLFHLFDSVCLLLCLPLHISDFVLLPTIMHFSTFSLSLSVDTVKLLKRHSVRANSHVYSAGRSESAALTWSPL